MDDSGIRLECALVAAAAKSGAPAARHAFDPGLDDAYAIQRSIAQRSHLPVMVWKLGLTGAGGRAAFGAAEPVIGRLPASAIYSDRSFIRHLGGELFAEAELVFELGADLPAQASPYSRDDLSRVITGLYAGIEIVRTRFDSSDLTLGQLVADNVMAHGLVCGTKLSDGWDDRFAAMPVSLIRNEEPPVEGSTANVMADPLDALVWLANWLREHEGYTLKREQLIASGTCTGATDIFPGDVVRIRFDEADAAQVTLDAEIDGE